MEFEVKVPLLGFDDLHKVQLEKLDDLFTKMMNVDNEYPSFMLVNPFMLREYSFDVPAAAKALLDINEDSQILVFNIMILNDSIEQSTINFIAPLIFNVSNKTMGQVVLDSGRYPQFGLTDSIGAYLNNEENEE